VSVSLSHPRINATLNAAVGAGIMPGVVAMATTADGPCYAGAVGRRRLGGSEAMTLDTVFRIASMTKAITCVAAMQLVERGKLSLDAPVPAIDPGLAQPQVLDGFDAQGKPILRPAKRPITLKHLMTHTAGFCYEQGTRTFNAASRRWACRKWRPANWRRCACR
jgi:methyl acetate hydrolase